MLVGIRGIAAAAAAAPARRQRTRSGSGDGAPPPLRAVPRTAAPTATAPAPVQPIAAQPPVRHQQQQQNQDQNQQPPPQDQEARRQLEDAYRLGRARAAAAASAIAVTSSARAAAPPPRAAGPRALLRAAERRLGGDLPTAALSLAPVVALIAYERGVQDLLDDVFGDSPAGGAACMLIGVGLVVGVKLTGARWTALWDVSDRSWGAAAGVETDADDD